MKMSTDSNGNVVGDDGEEEEEMPASVSKWKTLRDELSTVKKKMVELKKQNSALRQERNPSTLLHEKEDYFIEHEQVEV